MPEPTQPMTYADVLNLYKRVQGHPAVRGMKLPQFAQKLNKLTGSREFDAGLEDSPVKRFSVGFDTLLEKSGVPQASGELFAGLADSITPQFREEARSIGHGLPRTVLETAGLPLTFIAPPVGIPLVAGGAFSSFARGYTDTGSKAVGGISALANLGLPVAGRLGANFLTGPLSKAVLKATNSNTAARFVDFAGESIGASGLMELANLGSHTVTGKLSEYNPFSPENLFQHVAGQIAFSPLGIMQAMRGPKPGMFRSVGEQRLAEEKAKIEFGKQQRQKEMFVNTAVDSQTKIQFDLPEVPGPLSESQQALWQGTPLGAYGHNRQETLFGQPISSRLNVPSPAKRPTQPGGDIPLLSGPAQPTFMEPSEGVIRALIQGGLPTQPGVGTLIDPSTFYVKPAKEIVDVANKMLAERRVHQNAEGVREAATVANAAAEAGGRTPPINDATLAAKTEAHTEVLSLSESSRRVAQSVENKLNEEAALLSLKQQRELEAAKRLADLPESHKNLLGTGIAAATKATASDAYSDVMSANFVKAALNWYETNAAKLTDEALADPVQSAALAKDVRQHLLAKTRQAVATHKRDKEGGGAGEVRGLEREAGQTEAMPTPGDIELPSGPTPKGLSPFGEDAYLAEEQSHVSKASEVIGGLVGQKPVTDQEVASLGVKAPPGTAQRINAVLVAIAESAEFGTAGSRSKKGFKFQITNETRSAFGQVSDATIQDWVTKNLPLVRQVMEKRLLEGGVEASFASSLVKKNFMEIYWQDVDLSRPAPAGSLPLAARRFFHRYFLAAGHEPQEAQMFADVAERIALQFRHVDQTYISELVDKTGRLHGIALTETPNRILGAIGISLAEKIAPDSKGFNVFAKFLTAGHEIYHRLWNVATDVLTPGASAKGFRLMTELTRHIEEVPVQDRQAIMASLFRLVVPAKHLKDPEVIKFLADLNSMMEDPQEFIANYTGLLSLGAARGSGVKAESWAQFKEEIVFSDKFMNDFAAGFYTDLREVVGALKDLAVITGAEGTKAAKVIDTMHSTFTELARTRFEVEEAVARLRALETGMPEHFLRTQELSNFPPIVTDERVNMERMLQDLWPGGKEISVEFMRRAGLKKELEPYIGKRPNWFERNFMIPAHLRELYPSLNDVTDLLFGFRGTMNNWFTKALLPFGRMNKANRVVFDSKDPLLQVKSKPELEKAISQVFIEQNTEKRRLSFEEASNLRHMSGLSEADRATVWKAVEQTHASMAQVADLIADFKKLTIADTMSTTILGKVPGMRAKQAIALGEQAMRGMEMVTAQDPVQQAQGTQLLQSVQAALGPEVFGRIQQDFAALWPKFQQLQGKLNEQRSFFTPETRLGQFHVRYVKDGVKHFVGVEDMAAAVAKKNTLEDDATVSGIQIFNKADSQRDVNTLYGDVANVFADIERSAYERRLQEIRESNPDAADLIERTYTPAEAVFKEIAARGFGKHFLPRRLVPGREEINMMQGVVAYIEGMGTGMAKASTKRRASLLLADSEMKQNPAVRNLARDYVLNVVDPPAQEWSKVKNTAFHYFLGGNLSSILVELFQPLASLAPELTRQGSSVAGSYKLIGRAEAAVTKKNLKGDFGLPPEWDVEAAVKKAQAEQVLDFGVLQEMEGADVDTTLVNLRRMSSGLDPLGAQDLVKKPLYWYLHGTRSLYRTATSHNNKTAFLSGFIMQKERGASFDDAYNFGKKMAQNTMFGGGAASRPIGLFARSGKFYGAVGALYTLRHYTMSMLSDWWRLGKESLNLAGLPKEDVAAARKALGQMVSTQFLMSGAMGMPMAAASVALLEQAFPDLQIKAKMREVLDGLTGDDEEMGQFVSDMALKGVVSASLPIDVSSRFGLGEVFGIDPNRGANWKQLFGAPGSILERWTGGVQNVSTGNIGEAAKQLLPNSLGNLVKLYNDDFKARDSKGNLLYDPTEAEVLASSVGFRPKRLSYHRERQVLLERSDEIHRRQLGEFHNGLASLLLRGETPQVREALLTRAHEDDTYDPRAGLRAVVEAAQRKVVPMDLTRSGSRGSIRERESISQAIPTVAPRQSEVQLLAQRKQMERSVGVTGAGQVSRRELSKAQIVDRLLQLNPTWSRQHALLVYERIQGGN